MIERPLLRAEVRDERHDQGAFRTKDIHEILLVVIGVLGVLERGRDDRMNSGGILGLLRANQEGHAHGSDGRATILASAPRRSVSTLIMAT